jgi:altronate hydrolase
MATVLGPQKAVLLQCDDNVAVAARPIPPGTLLRLDGQTVEVREPIALGHKLALRPIEEGQPVRKYGQIIGFASRAITAGTHVHTHNLRADVFQRTLAQATETPALLPADRVRTFQGYLRPDGRVGTRNMIAVISTVNCSASTARMIADRFRDGRWKRDFPNVDGIFSITHKGGCGLPFGGLDHQILERVLAGFAHHPNVAAYVIVGLGCEGAQAAHLVETHHLRLPGAPADGTALPSVGSAVRTSRVGPQSGPYDYGSHAPTVLNIQDQGGITRTVEAAVRAVHDLLPAANSWRRTEQPASKLCLAMECGGSDGNSGITSNPALGVAADLVIAQGGSAVLGETTEIYGAEHLLAARAVSPAVGQKLLDRIKWWEWYTGVFGATIDNNPTPGNKAGGLTTIYEKSLGALAKAGSSPLVDVVDYAAAVTSPGLTFMDTPGYDPPCTTGLVAGGATVLVFTTGRGSVLGLKPTPCIKLATNSVMFERMSDDMDMNAGTILEGESVQSVGRRLFDLILEVASGAPTKSERLGVGEEEFAPWTIGPTL